MKRLKRIIALVLAFQVGSAFVYTEALVYAASPQVAITASSAFLYDSSAGRIVYSKTPHKKRAPASTTKILTAILAVEHLPLNKVITIPKFAESIEASKIYLRGGEKYYVKDLIRATLISSANDAAEVLAYAVSGSRSRFSRLMNKKARKLGAKNSNFIRSSGLPAKGQYSTAYDMSKIMKYARRYPFIVSTMRKKTMSIKSLTGRRIYLKNHNKMLWKDSREIFGKTGWTRRARYCFVGQMRVFGHSVLVSFLGSNNLWRDLKKLLDFQFGSRYMKIKRNQRLWSRDQTKVIQRALRRAGYNPGPIDGIFGKKTVRAIERFQRGKRLSADGIVGPATWGKLKAFR